MKVDIDALLELESKATPGPWFDYGDGVLRSGWIAGSPGEKEGIALIVAMRNNIRALCEELKAAREVVDAARDNIDAKEMPHKCYETPNCVTCEEIWTRINSSEDRIKMALKELDGTAGSKNG